MALTFGANSSDRCNVTPGAAINNFNPFSWCLSVFCTTRTSNRFLMAKNSTSQKALRLNGTTGNVELLVGRATTGTSYITNSTPLSTNVWQWFVVTFDSTASAGNLVQVYSGSRTAAMAAATFGTATDGSGAITSDAGLNLIIGNNSGNASAFQGRIGRVSVFNRALSLAEAQTWASGRHGLLTGAQLDYELGFDGTNSIVNWGETAGAFNGSVTGATVGDHHPLGPPYGSYEASLPYTVVTASAATPSLMLLGCGA